MTDSEWCKAAAKALGVSLTCEAYENGTVWVVCLDEDDCIAEDSTEAGAWAEARKDLFLRLLEAVHTGERCAEFLKTTT